MKAGTCLLVLSLHQPDCADQGRQDGQGMRCRKAVWGGGGCILSSTMGCQSKVPGLSHLVHRHNVGLPKWV